MDEPSTRDRALASAAAILRKHGYAQLTMERVAADSGVAKTTLYRRWRTKAALCMELYLDLAEREFTDLPDTGSIEEDLTQITTAVVKLQTKTIAGPALLGLIAEAQANPKTQAAFAEFSNRRREVTRTALQRAIKRGQLRRDTNIEVFIDALGGAVTFRLIQRHAPLTNDFIKALIRMLLDGSAPRRRK